MGKKAIIYKCPTALPTLNAELGNPRDIEGRKEDAETN